jgi:hypothetical protein
VAALEDVPGATGGSPKPLASTFGPAGAPFEVDLLLDDLDGVCGSSAGRPCAVHPGRVAAADHFDATVRAARVARAGVAA